MKNILIVLFSFTLVFPAAAQVAAPTPRDVREGIRQAAQEQMQTMRENFQATMEARRAELQSTMQARRDAFTAELQKVKDARKKAAVERIDKNLADLNSRMTTHYANVLDQIEEVLGRVISRTDTAQTNGRDVAAVRTAITNAQNLIAAARAAVAVQVGKVYTIKITSDAELRNDVGAVRQALHDDLKKVQDSVKAARDAVRQAAVALAQISGVDGLHKPTSTATSTNQ